MNWWHYLLLVNIYLLLFYSFYALLLRRETFFQLNRIYLVSASLLSFIIPMIQSNWVKNLFITEQVHYRIYGESTVVNIYNFHPVESSPVTIGEVLMLLYIVGITVLTARFALQLIRVNKILKTPEPSSAFAFFNKINLGENALDQQAVLAHEQVHAKQWHSLDVLLIETVMIMNWFNPVVYLYRFAIKHIHEYIADQQVIKIGADKAEYAMLLVSQTFAAPSSGLVSAFTGSLLKKRIKMLQKDRSKRIVLFKYMLSAPLFGLMLILSSATIEDNKAINMIQRHATVLFDQSAKSVINDVISPVDSADTHSAISDESVQEGKVYDAVDKEPEFPGGIDGFSAFLSSNIHYPAKAREKKIQGKAYIQFVIEPNGAVTNVKAVHGPSVELNAEAVRVVKMSPKWKPGLIADKKVRTSYTVPVNFTLDVKDVVLTPPPTTKEVTVIAYGNTQQPNNDKAEKVYEAVEHEPEFPGGQDAFNRFLGTVVRFPAVDRQNNVTGKVYVSFIVEPDGSLTDIKAVRGPSETEMAEAVRGIKLSPKWNPGIQNGKAVRVSYTVPVNFTLNRGEISQMLNTDGNRIYEAVEKEPEFPGGADAFNRFLAMNIKYPAIDRENHVAGKVYIRFIVEPDGSLSDLTAVRGPSETTKAEALRAVGLSPKWNPGIQNGKAVRVSYTVPVNFTLGLSKEQIAGTLSPDGNHIYEAVEHEPEFPGGITAFNNFLSNTVKYPAIDREKNVTGKVYISFIVEKDGSLSNVTVVRGPSETTKTEAARAIALSPKWKPGLQNGVAVRTSYTIPVNFTLTSDKDELAKVSSENIEVKWLKVKSLFGSGNNIFIIVNGKEFTGGINQLNPNDIRSIDILKDDDAIKKYGEKAKNGVIVIILK